MLCCHHLIILNAFLTKSLYFHSALVLSNYIAGPDQTCVASKTGEKANEVIPLSVVFIDLRSWL